MLCALFSSAAVSIRFVMDGSFVTMYREAVEKTVGELLRSIWRKEKLFSRVGRRHTSAEMRRDYLVSSTVAAC